MNHQKDKSKRKSSFPALASRHMPLLFFVVLLLFAGAVQGQASDRVFDEYQVKSVFLYRLTLFITWPQDAFVDAGQPFVIGILGDDPFGKHIDRVVSSEKFKSRPIHVRRYQSVEEIKKAPCQVLFVNQALKSKWPQIKQRIGTYPILSVSDMDDFGRLGGMITITTRVNRIKIEINPDETRKAGLKISSKLLKISRTVSTVPEGGRR